MCIYIYIYIHDIICMYIYILHSLILMRLISHFILFTSPVNVFGHLAGVLVFPPPIWVLDRLYPS